MHDAILKREQGKEGRKKGGEGEKNQGEIYIGLVSSKSALTWNLKDS